jgi:hypothetical protein
MRGIFRLLLLPVIICTSTGRTVLSQITSSPYSIFGLGSVEGSTSGAGNAMGGTGNAFMTEHNINFRNPASAGGLDSLVSVFELGFAGKYTTFTSARKEQSLFDANFRYMALAFRIAPRWAMTAGIQPYSTIGYNINVMSDIEGTTSQYRKSFSGEGGVNKVFLGNSVRLFRNLYIGINAAYLFGTVTHTESSDEYDYSLQEKVYISNFDLDYGLIYKFGLKKWNYTLGFTYDNGKTLNTNKETTINTASSSETTKNPVQEYRVPESYGFGIGFSRDFFRGGLDFETRRWADIEFANPLLRARNSNSYSFGTEFPSQGYRHGTSRMIFYRLGARYCESYMIIDGNPINYRSVSMGTGIPVKGYPSVINISFEAGQNGTAMGGLFRETFFTVHLDLSLKDLWFVKRKYD